MNFQRGLILPQEILWRSFWWAPGTWVNVCLLYGWHFPSCSFIQVLDPVKRLGCDEMGGYAVLKSHPFFDGIDWENLPNQSPPELQPYLPACGVDSENLWGQYKVCFSSHPYNPHPGMHVDHLPCPFQPGLDDQHLSQLQLISVDGTLGSVEPTADRKSRTSWVTDDERSRKLEKQAKENPYHSFVENNLIIKQGLLDKRVVSGLNPVSSCCHGDA